MAPHPGDVLKKKLRDRNMTIEELARRSKVAFGSINVLISGSGPIGKKMDRGFSKVLGTKPGFWLALAAKWRAELNRDFDKAMRRRSGGRREHPRQPRKFLIRNGVYCEK